MKTKIILLLLCIFSIGVASRAESPKPYSIYFEVELKSENYGNTGIRKMWIKGNDMRWDSSSSGLFFSILKNKQGVFLVYPNRKVAARYPNNTNRGNPKTYFPGPTGSPKVFLNAVDAVKTGRETVRKQSCDVFSYKDPASKRPCKIWISNKTGKPVQLLIKGDLRKADTVTAIYTRFNESASINDDIFAVPQGFNIRNMPERDTETSKQKTTTKRQRSGKSS